MENLEKIKKNLLKNVRSLPTRNFDELSANLNDVSLDDLWCFLRSDLCDPWDVKELAETAIISKLSLPALTGSPKQISWATTIRQQAILSIRNDINAQELPDPETVPVSNRRICEKAWETVSKAREKLLTETSAKWWIENRVEIEKYVELALRKFITSIN